MTRKEDSHGSTSRRKVAILGFVLKLAVTLALFVVIYRQTDFYSFSLRLRTISWDTVIGVLLLFLLQVLLSALRWRLVLAHQGYRVRVWLVLRAVFLERFINQVIPATVGGDAARIALLRRAEVPIRIGISSIVIDRATSIMGLVALMVFTAPLLLNLVPPISSWWMLIVGGLLVSLVGILVFLKMLEERRLPMVRFHFLAELLAVIRNSIFSVSLLFKAISLSVVIQLVLVSAFFILARSLDAKLGFLDSVVLLPPIFLAAMLPVSISGWGIREGGAIVLLAYAGVVASDALAASVLFGIGLLCTGIIGGFLWLVSGSEGRRPDFPPNF